MKKVFSSFVLGSALLASSTVTLAWQQPTHKQEVIDALNYMGSAYATEEMRRAYDFYVSAASGDAAVAADALGQACYDVDNFKDVRLGSWWRGYWSAPLFGMAHSIVGYNAYHHFVTMSRGEDAHGNAHGGYNYQHRTPNGSLGKGEFFDIDKLAAVYLWNTSLKFEDYQTTEANYRQGSFSDYETHYKRFQEMPWQPSTNAGLYWFKQFLAQPTFQMIGYSLHFLTDAGQVHHTLSTSANHHSAWESWAENNYAKESLNDVVAVHAAVSAFNPRDSVRTIILQLAQEAYTRPDPLFSTEHEARKGVASVMIPKTIGATVAMLTKAVNCLHDECGEL